MTYKTKFGDYDSMYGSLDYRGQVVLDIGADYGTTAQYFLERGAARVLVSERTPEWRAELHALAARNPVVTVLVPLDQDNAEAFLREHRPGIVKVDCERCEVFFLGVPDDALAIPRAWVMETHTRELYDAFVKRFARAGYTVTTVEEFPLNPPERCIKVLTAERKPGRGVA